MAMREFLHQALNKPRLLSIASAVAGAALGSALALLLLAGSSEAIGLFPLIVFGLMGAVGGAAYGTAIASGLGEAESPNDPTAERTDGYAFSESREWPPRTLGQPLPRSDQSFQERIARSHRNTHKTRG